MPGPVSNPAGGIRKEGNSGKTRRDRITGKWARHLRNMDARAKWNQEYMSSSKGGGLKIIPYPVLGT